MARFRKALVAALLAGVGSAAPFVAGGLQFNEVPLIALTIVVTGLVTYGVKNEGFVELRPLAELAASAYTEYSRVRGGVAYDGSPLPAWADLEDAIRDAWVQAQKAAVRS